MVNGVGPPTGVGVFVGVLVDVAVFAGVAVLVNVGVDVAVGVTFPTVTLPFVVNAGGSPSFHKNPGCGIWFGSV